jgi:hypothetical protein
LPTTAHTVTYQCLKINEKLATARPKALSILPPMIYISPITHEEV